MTENHARRGWWDPVAAVVLGWAVVELRPLCAHRDPGHLTDMSDHYAKDRGIVRLGPTRHAIVGGRLGLALWVALLIVVGNVSHQRWVGWVCGGLVFALLVAAGRFSSPGAVEIRQEGASVRVRGLWGWRYYPVSALQGIGVMTSWWLWGSAGPGALVVFLRVGGLPFAPEGGHKDVACWGLMGSGPESEELTGVLAELRRSLGMAELR